MTALIYTIVIILLIAADQITKHIVVANMELNQTVPAIEGLLDWTYILNDGASFGMMGGKTVFLIIVTCAVMGVLAWFLYSGKLEHITGQISGVLILAGGIGNLIDRIFNNGLVVDFIDIDPMLEPLFTFPKFNVADCCVCCGGVLFCVYILFFFDDKKKQTAEVPAEVSTGSAQINESSTETPEDSVQENEQA